MRVGRNVALLLALVATSVLVFAFVRADEPSVTSPDPQRSGFKFSKLFNFASFKKLFKKSYKSPSEASNREKIFLSHVFRAFVSKIRFSHKSSTYYLSVNEMSDWSAKEFEQTLMDPDTYYREANKYRAKSQALANLLENEEVDSMVEETLDEVDTSNNDNNKDSPAADGPTTTSKPPTGNKFSQMSSKFAADLKRQFKKFPYRKLNLGDKLLLFGRMIKVGHARMVNSIENYAIRRLYKPPGRREDLPDEVFFDHSTAGCLSRVKNQKQCGGCYIFATIAFYEWAYCRELGQQARFSEQYVIDCGRRMKMKGCEGGYEDEVALFSNKYGFEPMNDIFFTGRDSICPYDKIKDTPNKTMDNQDNQDDDDDDDEQVKERLFTEPDVPSEVGEEAMGMYKMDNAKLMELPGPQVIEQQLAISPVVFVFRTSKDFQSYGGGVDLGQGCEDRHGLHSVLIVGSGRQDGYEYWLVRNSYGSSWGDRGHWRIAKNSHCYTVANLGMITKALYYKRAPKALANSTIPLVELEKQTDEQVLVYNFTENPKHNRKFVYNAVTRILHNTNRFQV